MLRGRAKDLVILRAGRFGLGLPDFAGKQMFDRRLDQVVLGRVMVSLPAARHLGLRSCIGDPKP